jgi:hypothetical protein
VSAVLYLQLPRQTIPDNRPQVLKHVGRSNCVLVVVVVVVVVVVLVGGGGGLVVN